MKRAIILLMLALLLVPVALAEVTQQDIDSLTYNVQDEINALSAEIVKDPDVTPDQLKSLNEHGDSLPLDLTGDVAEISEDKGVTPESDTSNVVEDDYNTLTSLWSIGGIVAVVGLIILLVFMMRRRKKSESKGRADLPDEKHESVDKDKVSLVKHAIDVAENLTQSISAVAKKYHVIDNQKVFLKFLEIIKDKCPVEFFTWNEQLMRERFKAFQNEIEGKYSFVRTDDKYKIEKIADFAVDFTKKVLKKKYDEATLAKLNGGQLSIGQANIAQDAADYASSTFTVKYDDVVGAYTKVIKKLYKMIETEIGKERALLKSRANPTGEDEKVVEVINKEIEYIKMLIGDLQQQLANVAKQRDDLEKITLIDKSDDPQKTENMDYAANGCLSSAKDLFNLLKQEDHLRKEIDRMYEEVGLVREELSKEAEATVDKSVSDKAGLRRSSDKNIIKNKINMPYPGILDFIEKKISDDDVPNDVRKKMVRILADTDLTERLIQVIKNLNEDSSVDDKPFSFVKSICSVIIPELHNIATVGDIKNLAKLLYTKLGGKKDPDTIVFFDESKFGTPVSK